MDLGRRSIVEWAEGAPETDAAADFTPAQEKFVVERAIDRGGMGEVLLVTDQDPGAPRWRNPPCWMRDNCFGRTSRGQRVQSAGGPISYRRERSRVSGSNKRVGSPSCSSA